MSRRSCLQKWPRLVGTLAGGLLFLAAGAAVSAQEAPGTSVPWDGMIPGLKERAVVLNITARIVAQGDAPIWDSYNSKETILGRPVSLKLIGENVAVYVQLTPYEQGNGRCLLVAQGQIWINMPNEGVRYLTTLQSIPMDFGEQVYFFPLGTVGSGNEARIEIQLELRPYTEGVLPE